MTQENQIKIKDLNINYKTIGNGKILIVLLHGWGTSSNKYSALAEYLSQFSIFNFQFSIFIPDLPGFGKSEEPKENWNLDNYVEFVDEFIEEIIKHSLTPQPPLSRGLLGSSSSLSERLNNAKIILIGHSFGGRIAIKYAVKYPEKIDKLILTGAAGIKHKPTLKQRIFFTLAKIGKKVSSMLKKAKLPIGSLASESQKLLYKIAREKDYYQASPRMKEVMKNVLAEDLTLILSKTKVPTLLVWGKDDKSTPLADGKIMKEKIKNSKLVIIENANHSLPYQKPEEFAKIVLEFIKKEA